MKLKFSIAAITLCFLMMMAPLAKAEDFLGWTNVAKEIEKSLEIAMKTYGDGKTDEAMEQVADGYFVIFESEDANMEIAVRRFIGFKKAASLEKSFTDIRRAIYNKDPLKKIKEMTKDLSLELFEAGKKLDEKNISLEDIKFK